MVARQRGVVHPPPHARMQSDVRSLPHVDPACPPLGAPSVTNFIAVFTYFRRTYGWSRRKCFSKAFGICFGDRLPF